jgi:hypothetical protein
MHCMAFSYRQQWIIVERCILHLVAPDWLTFCVKHWILAALSFLQFISASFTWFSMHGVDGYCL